jgi:iron complex transport system ATP-binding protein
VRIPIEGINAEIRENTLIIDSESPLRTLSSAVVGGGFRSTRFVLNTHVSKDYRSDLPEKDLQEIAGRLGIRENFVGMMTAVDLRNVSIVSEGNVTAVVTGGVSNAIASGETSHSKGTINIILIIDANLADSAMVSAVITATEAKTLALHDLNIKSRKSGEIATGTSTDSIVIACTRRGGVVRYAGGATSLGRLIGKTTRKAVREAIIKQENLLPI